MLGVLRLAPGPEAIAGVLRPGGWAQIRPAVVEPIPIDVIDHVSGRHGQDDPVHLDRDLPLGAGVPDLALGVPGVPAPRGVPLVPSQLAIVGRIDLRIQPLRQRDPAVRGAESQPTVDQDRPDAQAAEPKQLTLFDVTGGIPLESLETTR